MEALEVLKKMRVGNGVAEFDDSLERYFVETEVFRSIVDDRYDIISGDKGTGKTALFKILRQRYTTLAALDNVEVVPAFNVQGSPIFARLNEDEPYSEPQYSTLWKGYFLALAGNWILLLYEDDWTPAMQELSDLLTTTGLRSADDTPSTVFSTIVNLFRRLTHPISAEATVTITEQGLPIVIPRLEFGDPPLEEARFIPHHEALGLLDRCLGEIPLNLWLVMDRLDEAFAGTPAAEVPALRALLRTYLDLLEFPHIRLKLFVRNDLFRRIIAGGFVNLTHINARKVEITWDEESLAHVLGRRLSESKELMEALHLDQDASAFPLIFPDQVDQGDRKPKTLTWMMARIRDGNGVRPPRNLIDLVQKAQDAAIRKEEREHSEFTPGVSLIPPEAMKQGLRSLSKQRVEDTLLAEAGSEASLVEQFRNGKAEHNRESIASQLRLEGGELDQAILFLKQIGFLEAIGSSLKIPALYRDGLSITQGKAFAAGVGQGSTAAADDDDYYDDD